MVTRRRKVQLKIDDLRNSIRYYRYYTPIRTRANWAKLQKLEVILNLLIQERARK